MSLFLCGETGIINRGCEAIIRSTIKILNEKSGNIYLATSAPEMDMQLAKELGINLIKYNSFPTKYHRYYAAFMRKIGHSVDGKYLQASLFSHLEKGDLCLNIGGDTYCYGIPSRSIELNRFTNKNKINNILWCCSIEFSAMHGSVLSDLKKYRYIFAREEVTYNNLLKVGINKNKIIKCCDPAFFLDSTITKLPDGFLKGNTIGINISEMIVSEKHPNAYSCIVDFIVEILEKTDMTICLIPHVYDIQKNLCDWAVLSKIYDEIHSNRVCIVDKEYNCKQLKYIISQCRFMIAARTHASIAAYSTEVPTLVLGYSIKSKGIAQDLFGTDEHYVLSNENISSQSLSNDFWYIYENEQSIRERLHDFLPEYRQQLLDGMTKIKSLDLNSDLICNPTLCTGCQACRLVCPKSCISMKESEDGFIYPVVDQSICIHCGKCKTICPVVNRYKDNCQIPQCFLAINKDDNVRGNSSSGGVFYELAKSIIKESGVVFGAVLDDNQKLSMISCTSLEEVRAACGSKYIQADVGDSYKEVEQLLQQGKKVLYAGTSCQIGGLNAYLGVDYKNLITVDTICHGVPSPKAWNEYKTSIEDKFGSKISSVLFRCKKFGWKNYSLRIDLKNGKFIQEEITNNIYLQAFITHLIMRSSCYNCSFKQIHRQTDITLGDFWGIDQWDASYNDNKGASIVFLHSEKGRKLYKKIITQFRCEKVPFSQAVINNNSYFDSCEPSPYKSLFDRKWKRHSFIKTIKLFCAHGRVPDLYRKIKLITNWKWK